MIHCILCRYGNEALCLNDTVQVVMYTYIVIFIAHSTLFVQLFIVVLFHGFLKQKACMQNA